MMQRVLIFLVLAFSGVVMHAQILFPDLDGQELRDALRTEYTPASTLTLAQAKDTLYLLIDRELDSVECVYSGLTLHLPEGVDPSQWLFQNGSGINLEHVYPQSKGADEGMPGHSDMHHLHPSRVAVNEARASHPFAEIPDAQTTTWYKDNLSMQSIPTQDIDGYSEARNGAFEPREAVKGNIARAVFYFYTIYQSDADAADPNFFPMQREALCQWHLDDPVDEAELMRSTQVAQYQDGKENPFVLDCTAALRAWCPELMGCASSTTQADDDFFRIIAYRSSSGITVEISTEKAQEALMQIHDVTGRILARVRSEIMAGTSRIEFAGTFSPGMYTVTCLPENGGLLTTKCIVY